MLAYFKRLFDRVYVTAKAQAGASGTITLAASASAIDDTYIGQAVTIVEGTGIGQSKIITDYNGTTKVADIESAWETNPDATSVYMLTSFPGIKSLVGVLDESVDVPYVLGDNSILAHLNTAYYHVHGQSLTYPKLASAVTLTAGAGAWDNTGAITEVVPVDTLTTAAFDLHWMNVNDISGNGEALIQIYSGLSGAEVEIGSAKVTRNAVQSQEGSKRIQIPQQPAGTRISCRLSDGTGGALTCDVSFEGHYYA